MDRREERRAAYRARVARSAERRGPRRFVFNTSGQTEYSIIWDDAGYDHEDKLVLVEVESGPIVNLHVEGHLIRLAFMLAQGLEIAELIWVVKLTNWERLRRIVHNWLQVFKIVSEIELPTMVCLSINGSFLCQISAYE